MNITIIIPCVTSEVVKSELVINIITGTIVIDVIALNGILDFAKPSINLKINDTIIEYMITPKRPACM